MITDTSRIYGIAAAFWASSSEAQRSALVGFSADLLALAVHEAHRLERANEEFQRQNDDDRTVREVTARDLGDHWGEAIRWKSHAAKVLRPLAGGDGVRATELRRATSGTEDPDELARRLDDLAALTRRWSADPGLALQVKLARLTEAYPASLDRVAQDLRQAANAARARKTVQVSQGDLDALDGRNLYLIRQIIDVFDEAHGVDPTIPRLIPIALAGVLGRRRPARASTAAAAPPEPAEEPEVEAAPEVGAEAEPEVDASPAPA